MLPSVSTNVWEKEGAVERFSHITALGMGIKPGFEPDCREGAASGDQINAKSSGRV